MLLPRLLNVPWTSGPAKVLGMHDRGTLKPGTLADIALFSLAKGDFPLYDILGEQRNSKELLVNEMTIVGGRPMIRRPPHLRAPWFEPWGTAGRDVSIVEFQRELIKRGHTPAAMGGKRRFTCDGAPAGECACGNP